MISYSFTGLLGGEYPSFSTNITDLDIAWVGGMARLYSATAPGAGAGYCAYDLSGTSGLSGLHAMQGYGGAVRYGGAACFSVLAGPGGGAPVLIAAGLQPSGWASYQLTGAGGFGASLNTALGFDPTAVTGYSTAQSSYVYLTPAGSAAPLAYLLGANGQLGAISGSVTPAAGHSVSAIETIPTAQGGVLLSVNAGANLISSYRITATGALVYAGCVPASAGIGFSRPTDVSAITVAGVSYAIVAASESGSLSVFRILPNGQLFALDHVVDSLATRFAQATALHSFCVADRAFVVVGGQDGGFDVMTLLPDGRLIHLMTVVDDGLTSLANVSALSAAQVAGRTMIFAASSTETGISQFDVNLGTLGVTLNRLAGVANGTANNDLLIAGATTTALYGGAGDDILVGGGLGAQADLYGGAGADLFVISASTTAVHIRDFRPAVDRLDLTTLSQLRSVGQLVITTTATGAQITYRNTVIVIDSFDGNPIQASTLLQSNLLGLTRYAPTPTFDLVVGTNLGDTISATTVGTSLVGLDGNDTLSGNIGNDFIDGGNGNDSLLGGLGNDSVTGLAGNDWLFGGGDDDSILGGLGDDLIYGNSGNDTVRAGIGNDKIWGQLGDNQIWGDNGDDSLYGDSGKDCLNGGADNDFLSGALGDDQLWGGDGNDTINGGDGNDSISGGIGNDVISANAGNDTIRAGDGNDKVWGQLGFNQIWGEGGNDSLCGDADNDSLFGGAGNDSLAGIGGNDLLMGGEGNDSIVGGVGADRLYGELGSDQFIFRTIADLGSGPGSDLIGDFQPGQDKLVLSGLGLRLSSDATLHAIAGEVAFMASGSNGTLYIDTDGNGTADLSIRLTGITAMSATDFIF